MRAIFLIPLLVLLVIPVASYGQAITPNQPSISPLTQTNEEVDVGRGLYEIKRAISGTVTGDDTVIITFREGFTTMHTEVIDTTDGTFEYVYQEFILHESELDMHNVVIVATCEKCLTASGVFTQAYDVLGYVP